MFWQDEDDKTLPFEAPETMFDVLFNIECKAIPIDHAWALSQEVQKHLDWLKETPGAGIHHIHVAESNNGWFRPETEDALLFPSKRSKLVLRIPAAKYDKVKTLSGKHFDLEGHSLIIGKQKKKLLGNSGTIFARHVLSSNDQSEHDFLAAIATEIEDKTGTQLKKMMCGKTHTIKTPETVLMTRHLMIADLDDETSLKLQQYGLGEAQELGCGLFLPHKSIKTLKPTE